MSQPATTLRAEIETPTGKGPADENFPVASWLIAPGLRPHVAAFYAFARAADDIADNPALGASEKLRRLDLFEAGLDGPGPAKARRLAQSLSTTGVTDRHARDLLAAFRLDAVKTRYASWHDLLGYCALSANPVGRFLMDLHGEDAAMRPASDALCTALQILNHLQDCRDDYLALDRVYLPLDMLDAEGLDVAELAGERMPAGLRGVFDAILAGCATMLRTARARPVHLRSRRLHGEMVVITALAGRLARHLRTGDPLAGPVKLSRADFAVAAVRGLAALLRPGAG